MKKNNQMTAHSAEELAAILGLSPADALEIKIKSDLNDKIIETAKKKKLTHAQMAKLAGSSRTRITAIMNRNTKDISTDLMLRVISSLGLDARIVFKKAS